MTLPSKRMQRSLLRRMFDGLLAVLAAIWLLLEDWVWDTALAAMRWLGRLPLVHWIETRFASLPAWAALLAFLLPAAVLLPFKLAALWLIAHQHALMKMMVFVSAKLVGTALLARVFSLTKPQLMTIPWFKRLHDGFVLWKARIFTYVRALPAVRRGRAILHRAARLLRGWRRVWLAKWQEFIRAD